MSYISTKTFTHETGLSCAFRQWKAQSHCRLIHGYSLQVKFTFQGEPDNCGWVVDFGSMKTLKTWLEKTFDHTLLVAADDPHAQVINNLHRLGVANVIFVEATGCEAFAKLIFDNTEVWLQANAYSPRCHLVSVEVSEHGANSAIYIGE